MDSPENIKYRDEVDEKIYNIERLHTNLTRICQDYNLNSDTIEEIDNTYMNFLSRLEKSDDRHATLTGDSDKTNVYEFTKAMFAETIYNALEKLKDIKFSTGVMNDIMEEDFYNLEQLVMGLKEKTMKYISKKFEILNKL